MHIRLLLNRSPLLTVVIPLYNVELYVADAIGSILNQEFDDYEIIVINDGSQDRSVDVVKQMMQTEERICLYHQENRRSEEHTSELQSRGHLVCRLLLEKKN